MWIATTKGFFSAVQESAKDARMLSIRGRSVQDLENLAQWLHDERGYVKEPSEDYPTIKSMVITDIGRPSDYPARVFVWREDWAAFVMSEAMTINYTNFKTAVGKVNSTRAHTYHDVWAALRRITTEGRRKPYKYDWKPSRPSGTLMDLLPEMGDLGASTLAEWRDAVPAGESDRRCEGCDRFVDQCPNKGACITDADLALLDDDDQGELFDQDVASAYRLITSRRVEPEGGDTPPF